MFSQQMAQALMFLIVKTVTQHGRRKIVVCRMEGSAEVLI